MTRQRFEHQGFLAIEPRAFLEMYTDQRQEPAKFELIGDVAVVDVKGPLMHHEDCWYDSYDCIVDRVSAAMASSAKTVVMRIDSPGGMASGCFEATRSLRAVATAANKPFVVHVEGQACSAGYSLASAADRIVASDSAILGSIGVIQTRVDVSEAYAGMGVKFSFITSGSRKADGHPQKAFTPEEMTHLQGIVDQLASLFFQSVQEMRGIDAKPLDASLFVGAQAKAAGLVDDVMSYQSLLASLASGGIDMSLYTDARSALEEAAKGDDEEAGKASKVLNYMTGLENEDESDETPSEESDKDEPSTESEEPKDEDEPEASTVVALAAKVEEQARQIAALTAQSTVQFLATRKDLSPALVAVLKNKPLAEARAIVDALPKQAGKKKPVVTATVAATRGALQGDVNESRQAPDAASKLRDRMGLGEPAARGVENKGVRLILGASVPGKGK